MHEIHGFRYVLNALAEKMSAMDQQELETVGGLIRMEKDPERISAETMPRSAAEWRCVEWKTVTACIWMRCSGIRTQRPRKRGCL